MVSTVILISSENSECRKTTKKTREKVFTDSRYNSRLQGLL